MTDLHKALTDLCDRLEPNFHTVHISWIRAALAEHPPTAPVVDREALVDVLVMTPMADGLIDMSTAYRTADAIIAYLDGGEGS